METQKKPMTNHQKIRRPLPREERQSPALVLSKDEALSQAQLFKALADPMRLRILHYVSRAAEAVSVSDLALLLPVQPVTIQHHVRVLQQAGLLDRRPRQGGPWVSYTLNHARVQQALDLLRALA